MKRKFYLIVTVLLVALFAFVACDDDEPFTMQGVTNLSSLHLEDAGGTATPVLLVNQTGTGRIVEFSDAGTPVAYLDDGGGWTATGGQTNSSNLVVNAPTTIATATPAVYVNNAGVSQPLSVNDGGTEVLGVRDGGGVVVAAPTAIGTAQPAFVVDSSGGLSNILEVRDSATPVMQINDGGLVDIGGGTGGTANGAGDLLVAADAEIDNTLDVDGDIDLDGDGFDVDITAGFSIDGNAASNINTAGAGIDLTLESEAGRVVIIGKEAAADGVYIDANEAAGTGVDIDVGSTGGVSIDGGPTDIGSGTYDVATGDNDLGVAGDVEVEGAVNIEGAVTLTQTNAAGASANPWDWTNTAGIMDGSDTLEIIDINLTSANHTSTSNVLTGVSLTIASADPDAEESAITFSAGWDNDLNAVTSLDLSVDDNVVLSISDPPAVNASGDLVDITATNAGGDGSDVFKGIDLNLTGTSGSSTNTTYGLEVGLASAQADQDEAGIYFTDNWDADIDAATDLVLAVDSTTIVTVMDPQAAGSGGDLIDVTATFGIMDGTDTSIGIDVNLTGANHTGSTNYIRGVDLALTTPDADATEVAVYIGDNWDADIDATTDMVLAVDDTTIVTLMDPQAAGTGGDLIDITATFGAMDGSDTSLGIDLNLTGANASGTTNLLTGIDIDLTTADAQVTEKAIDVSDSDFDYAIDAGEGIIFSSAMFIKDDFWGDTIEAKWILLNGSDAEAVDPAIVANEQYGVVTLVSGDTNNNCAADCSQMNTGTIFRADQGGLVFETRLHIDAAITNASVCAGFTDVATLEAPASATGGGDGITAVADDAIAFCFDDAATTKEWFSFGIDGTTQATGNGMVGTGPTQGVYQVLRIEVDAGGEDARFYIDGALVDTLTANVVTITDDLCGFVSVDTNTTASITVDVDYIIVAAQR